jgi:hypothetical protein
MLNTIPCSPFARNVSASFLLFSVMVPGVVSVGLGSVQRFTIFPPAVVVSAHDAAVELVSAVELEAAVALEARGVRLLPEGFTGTEACHKNNKMSFILHSWRAKKQWRTFAGEDMIDGFVATEAGGPTADSNLDALVGGLTLAAGGVATAFGVAAGGGLATVAGGVIAVVGLATVGSAAGGLGATTGALGTAIGGLGMARGC